MANTFNIEINHHGETVHIQVPEDKTILAAAQEAGLELPFSCSAGVCTTCAALITEGTVDQADGMGVGTDLQAEGYALLCVAYPRSDIKLETNKEDIVYQKQFGQSS
ncbi:2Fe-2S iron-sulfur cluster-binding protein [Oscillatoria sp. CS-180]|uniref:2Fe-2S iron-sulfur cluster-binding protein n=1 Tax=Oscillatoria sp. CS-180 TaxID=3021720 RepID=UPI00232B0FB5|nr:2Fe-2S iron-sulfur cluster-binding protein [Oscillatoria sp. CS-180]MDB9525605.1 2Fe-2S iron-sulfur cluster-binding protein [Oscillatoria sp. CS-180]